MAASRVEITTSLSVALESLEFVQALSEAGSAAFGRLDEYSDIDLVADCEDGCEQATLDAAERALSALAPLDGRYELPQPTWHGMAQRFWHLAGSSEYLLVDFCARPRSKAGLFTEAEQHGSAVVYFDKQGITTPRQLDHAELRTAIEARRAYHRATFSMFAPLVPKELLRGHALDALHFYHGIVLRALVELLRMRHCPERYSFGLRYLDFDLPMEDVAALRRLAFPASAEELLTFYEQARQWVSELLDEAPAAGGG